MKLYIVTAVDFSDTSDHKPRVVIATTNKELAESEIDLEMRCFLKNSEDKEISVDSSNLNAWNEDYSFGCEWNMEEVEVND